MGKIQKNLAIFTFILYLSLNFQNISVAEIQEMSKFPDYGYEYLGKDKFENFNRKMFNFNLKMNKYALRPIHIIWASIMPKYGMDRIQGIYTNIQYPKRLLSSVIQKDFKSTKKETIRFITNSTIGIAGMFNPAEHIFNLDSQDDGMEDALSKCRVKQGPYIVMPWIASTTPRGMVGSLLDNALNPSNYIAAPIVALVKMGFTINKTYYMQPICKMLESTYADPYDIAKKLYGIEKYIKDLDLDKKELLETSIKLAENSDSQNGNPDDIKDPPNNIKNKIHLIKSGIPTKKIINNVEVNNKVLTPDINLDNYRPQNPVIDAMRTALFEQPNLNKSIWSEFSIWNRCFKNRIKTASVSIDSTRPKYQYRYILQRDKSAPVAIIYPSIGEGVNSHHSVVLAKMFYDEGYSVIIQGSHFQWEFVKSMPKNYRPGFPSNDADYLKLVTYKILDSLEDKYNCQFREKTLIGTSFGAMTTLFVAEKESKNSTLNINNYISINPPVELLYAMREIDKNTEEWKENPNHLKDRVALTASKIIQLTQLKEKNNKKIEILPFNDNEAKLITGFVLHQKLSDLIFTIENGSKLKKTNIYSVINNMNYEDYANKYLANNNKNIDDLSYETSMYSISNYLKENENYKIYHSIDDYLVNKKQLQKLKEYSGNKLVLFNNGSHLGFLYRNEFISALKNDISQHKEILATHK